MRLAHWLIDRCVCCLQRRGTVCCRPSTCWATQRFCVPSLGISGRECANWIHRQHWWRAPPGDWERCRNGCCRGGHWRGNPQAKTVAKWAAYVVMVQHSGAIFVDVIICRLTVMLAQWISVFLSLCLRSFVSMYNRLFQLDTGCVFIRQLVFMVCDMVLNLLFTVHRHIPLVIV